MCKIKSWQAGLVVSVMLLCAAAFAFAGSVPQLLNYQGTLTNKDGSPVANGAFNKKVTFRMYSSNTSGAVLWSETWGNAAATPPTPSVIVTDGTFNAMLGYYSQIPQTFFATYPKTFLGVTVEGDSEMLPRQQLTSVGYAFTAGNGIPQGGIIMWSGAVTAIPSGWALCDGTNGTPNLTDRFVVGAGAGYAVGTTGGNATINFEHLHTATIASSGSHLHTGTTGNNSAAKQRADDNSIYYSAAEPHTHTFTTDAGGGTHTHPVTVDKRLSATQDIRPPYYALAFIMKL